MICFYAYRYVCLGGSSSPTPSDGSHGYLCPSGHSCPVGSVSEIPCEPGTYNPAPGAARCITCPKGTVCSSTATQEPSICPAGKDGENEPSISSINQIIYPFRSSNDQIYNTAVIIKQYLISVLFLGHFCPAGTALPQPCPLGTFSNQTGAHSLSVCTHCPSGVYCSSHGASTPQGDQAQRYFIRILTFKCTHPYIS